MIVFVISCVVCVCICLFTVQLHFFLHTGMFLVCIMSILLVYHVYDFSQGRQKHVFQTEEGKTAIKVVLQKYENYFSF
jgi:hypothetical protein